MRERWCLTELFFEGETFRFGFVTSFSPAAIIAFPRGGNIGSSSAFLKGWSWS